MYALYEAETKLGKMFFAPRWKGHFEFCCDDMKKRSILKARWLLLLISQKTVWCVLQCYSLANLECFAENLSVILRMSKGNHVSRAMEGGGYCIL